ncbi:MAG: hypothetical protein BA872_03390 [Desulfobacterales bacterium C00003060]|nr:MAG: hypothetical protein BA872_03390 [Desulfobacterales bacterium C00003060]
MGLGPKKTAMVLRDFGIPEELITNDLFLDRDTGMGSDQAKCMIEQEKSEKLHSFWALECRFCG